MRTLLAPASSSPAFADLALLVSRVALGLILVMHGWQKYHTFTLDGTAATFAEMGIPAADTAAVAVTAVELIGGAALILGLLAPLAALANIVVMLGAIYYVHLDAGFFVDEGGYEFVLALVAGLVVIAAFGAGRLSIDGLFRKGGRKR